jgi:hypothetical protein
VKWLKVKAPEFKPQLCKKKKVIKLLLCKHKTPSSNPNPTNEKRLGV